MHPFSVGKVRTSSESESAEEGHPAGPYSPSGSAVLPQGIHLARLSVGHDRALCIDVCGMSEGWSGPLFGIPQLDTAYSIVRSTENYVSGRLGRHAKYGESQLSNPSNAS